MDAASVYDTRNAGGLQGAKPMLKTAEPRAINHSCFSVADGVADRVCQLSTRVSGIVERLVGVQPETAAQDGRPSPNGLLDCVEIACLRIGDDVDRMHVLLDRLEKRLP